MKSPYVPTKDRQLTPGPTARGGKAMGRISAWVLLAASVLVAVPGAAVQAQPPPKTLHIAVGIDADTLDPAGQTTTTVANMVDYIYETLLRPDYAGGTVAPQLATSWTVRRDGRMYTFRLRRGATWQDGTSFDAYAVKFKFERLPERKTRVLSRILLVDITAVPVL